MSVLKNVINNQIENYIEKIKRLKEANLSNSFNKSISLDNSFKDDIQGTNIYIIKTDFLDKDKIIEAYKNQDANNLKLSSLNNTTDFNGILYVGISNSLKYRINLHLGFASERVYSLHLKKWFNFKNKKLIIEIYPINSEDSDLGLIIENGLWDFYKPLFGKKGTNIKQSINL